MREMSVVYCGMASKQLKTLLSRKKTEVQRLERKPIGYFNGTDLRKLRQQIIWIEAVLESRDAQLELL